MSDKEFDYLIVGGGLSGSITSLLLKKELPEAEIGLIEKYPGIGGITLSQKTGGYYMDSIYMFPGIRQFLDYLSIDFDLYQYHNAFYSINLIDPGSRYRLILKPDISSIESSLARDFPGDRVKIKKFWQDCLTLEKNFLDLKTKMSIGEFIKMPFVSPKFLKTSGLTYDKFIRSYKFKDPQLTRLLNTFSGLSNLPPGKVNALIPVIAIVSLTKGCYRAPGLFDELNRIIEKKLNSRGVKLYLKTQIRTFHKKNKIFHLETGEAKSFTARNVISSIDTQKFFLDIASKDMFPASYIRRIQQLEMTLSCFIIKLVIKTKEELPDDTGQILFYAGNDTFSIMYNKAVRNLDPLDDSRYHFAVNIKRSSNKNHYYLEVLCVPVSYQYWKAIANRSSKDYRNEVKRWESFYMDKLDEYLIPGIRTKIQEKKIITPVGFGGMFNLTEGTCYDMAQINSQSGLKRPGFKTPVPGLYHNKTVHGIYGAFFQSFLLADYLLKGKINQYRYRY